VKSGFVADCRMTAGGLQTSTTTMWSTPRLLSRRHQSLTRKWPLESPRSVYLAPSAVGRGIGSMLYGALFPRLVRGGIHAVIGGIALPNQASVRLHERFGMTQVAQFKGVGFKFDQWIDVGYWQRTLES